MSNLLVLDDRQGECWTIGYPQPSIVRLHIPLLFGDLSVLHERDLPSCTTLDVHDIQTRARDPDVSDYNGAFQVCMLWLCFWIALQNP
jgi:hypothetical protein